MCSIHYGLSSLVLVPPSLDFAPLSCLNRRLLNPLDLILQIVQFNSFLPILLEDRVDPTSAKSSRVESLEELVLYNIAGCPGALVRKLIHARQDQSHTS